MTFHTQAVVRVVPVPHHTCSNLPMQLNEMLRLNVDIRDTHVQKWEVLKTTTHLDTTAFQTIPNYLFETMCYEWQLSAIETPQLRDNLFLQLQRQFNAYKCATLMQRDCEKLPFILQLICIAITALGIKAEAMHLCKHLWETNWWSSCGDLCWTMRMRGCGVANVNE